VEHKDGIQLSVSEGSESNSGEVSHSGFGLSLWRILFWECKNRIVFVERRSNKSAIWREV
jgi:hypothetical protein